VVLLSAALFGAVGAWHMAITDDFAPPVLILPALGLAVLVYIVWYLYRTVRGLLFAIENKPYG
jgi:uncharacterized membrane protein